MNCWLTRVSGGLIALALVASATGAARADVHLDGTLFPFDPTRTDTGQAVYDMTPDRATLSVAVQNVFRVDSVDVFVNGAFIGTIALDVSGEFGSGELDLDTANGDDVPILQEGDEIEVFAAATDTRRIVIGKVYAPDSVILFDIRGHSSILARIDESPQIPPQIPAKRPNLPAYAELAVEERLHPHQHDLARLGSAFACRLVSRPGRPGSGRG